MRLKSFKVKGYKNLKETVELEDLGPINILHGENNIGKSNVLEAMHLFFETMRLMTNGTGDRLGMDIDSRRYSREQFRGTQYDPSDVFNLDRPSPIEMTAIFGVESEELATPGIDLEDPIKEVTIASRLVREGNAVVHHFVAFKVAAEGPAYNPLEAQGVASVKAPLETSHTIDAAKALQIVAFLVRDFLRHGQEQVPRFALLPMDRRRTNAGNDPPERSRTNVGNESANLTLRGRLIPASLCLELYDAKESTDPKLYRRWELFRDGMNQFADVLRGRGFVALYDRKNVAAMLALETESTRLPAHLLGSGVQQIAVLLGHLLMTSASWVAIEEPELNLRYTLQLRLRDVLQGIVGTPNGPQQLFLTSHSPAFEMPGSHFYAMWLQNGSPVVERRRAEDAGTFTEHTAVAPNSTGRPVLSYVSSDGLVQIPTDVLERVGLRKGGGVFFVHRKDSGHVEMLTNEQFFGLLESEE